MFGVGPCDYAPDCPPRTVISCIARFAWNLRLLVTVSFFFTFLGCAANRYYAASLPVELQAPPIDNAQTVDLSRLAMATSNTNVIDRGDVLDVTISAGLSEDDTFSFPVRVNEDGAAQLPFVGPVALAGLELEGAEAAITTACVQQGLYRSPHVTVTMKRQRVNRVTVIGAVENPGVYELPRGASDLLAALVSAGGLSEDAGTQVEIRQPTKKSAVPSANPAIAQTAAGETVAAVGHSTLSTSSAQSINSFRIDLVSAAKAGSNGYYVEDGSVVMVEKRDPQPVHVLGLVHKPGRYDYPVSEELRVLDAIALAGGTSVSVADKVFVIRRLPEMTEPVLIQVSLRKAKQNGDDNLRLTPGDVVSVEQTVSTALLEIINIIRFGIGTTLTLF